MGSVVLGELPALPLHTAGKYVAAAYIVLFALVLIYVAIMAIRLSRTERELGELLQSAERADAPEQSAQEADVAQPESTLA
jgi:flagellar biosynthesis/type III secretory pathway M-ring protein FliF/YscJ